MSTPSPGSAGGMPDLRTRTGLIAAASQPPLTSAWASIQTMGPVPTRSEILAVRCWVSYVERLSLVMGLDTGTRRGST